MVTDKTAKVSWSRVNVSIRQLVADRIEKIDDNPNIGTGVGQIAYHGSWTLAPGTSSDPRYLNNDHYDSSSVKTDYFEMQFKGAKIDIYSTVASHHGTGWASIDGGAESKVNYKATQRAEQVLLWSSPILANREHLLKIRVGGDGVVTADRFDVSVSDKPDVVTATVKEVTATFSQLTVKLEDMGTSIILPESVRLTIDSTLADSVATKVGVITTVTYNPTSSFAPGTTHALRIEAKDSAGTSITNLSTFTLPPLPFPLAGLGGPVSTAGRWGFRQIWNAGRADAISSAVEIALKANRVGFLGKVDDEAVSTVNYVLSSSPGTAGLFPDPLPLPAETAGLTTSDFVVVAAASVKIPHPGDWTIGVHADDAFSLRFIGAPVDSVNGTGARDDYFTEYMSFLNPGETMTRGVLKGLAAGIYSLEFIGFQRARGAHFEIYATGGAYADDAATDQWQLIGSVGGLEIVSGVKLTATTIKKTLDQMTIDFNTPLPDGQHQLLESSDLVTWQIVAGVTLTKTGDHSARISVNNVTGANRYYRVRHL